MRRRRQQEQQSPHGETTGLRTRLADANMLLMRTEIYRTKDKPFPPFLRCRRCTANMFLASAQSCPRTQPSTRICCSARSTRPPASLARRACLFLPLLLPAAATAAAVPQAPAPPVADSGVDAQTSAFIQERLKRTSEKKEERVRERLQAYNVRNFKDYFSFEIGGGAKSSETQEAIRTWLKEHP